VKLAIMQPYFFPYIGYYQLLNAVDEFVVYDNIEFSKGWTNRNRILVGCKHEFITLPLKKDSDYLQIVERSLADVWAIQKGKLLNRIMNSYRKAPYYSEVFPLLEEILAFADDNLFRFLLNCLVKSNAFIGIETPLIISSTIGIDHSLKAQDRVLAICQSRRADHYINPIGGMSLYDSRLFNSHGIRLNFLETDKISYLQFESEFVPSLSIIDVLMFNSREQVRQMLTKFILK
jgi:hypothetical protein